MKIVIVGCGKVGSALTEKLVNENHDITVIDTNPQKVHKITEEFDVMGIAGNGFSNAILSEAGAENADVFIAVTGSDEFNLLCCMFAKRLGDCQTIARVRNPMYSPELEHIKNQLKISAIINPELASAREIANLMRFPAAEKIDTFADGKVMLIKFTLTESMGLDNIPLKDLSKFINSEVLICAVEREHTVVIPGGNFYLRTGDDVTVLASKEQASAFFADLNVSVKAARNAIIVGGGNISYYLAKALEKDRMDIRIFEQKIEKCESLAELLPDATILHGDGTDRKLLMAEGLANAEAFVSLTNIDEENVLISLFAKKQSKAKIVTKINRLDFDDILSDMNIGSVIYPKYLTCDFILQHVRALQNKSGSNIKTLYNILDDRVEALEFNVSADSKVANIPLAELKLKKNLLICCIMRSENIIIPGGKDSIQVGDNVIIITLDHGLQDLQDILA